MAEFFQLLIIGLSQGCIYGLIAMGFVMIYKATEMVNFAQGDIMMLGSFMAFTLIVTWGFDFWLGLLLAMVLMALFGFLVDAVGGTPHNWPAAIFNRYFDHQPRFYFPRCRGHDLGTSAAKLGHTVCRHVKFRWCRYQP